MRGRSIRGRVGHDGGNTAVEFALVLPLLVFMVVGVMDVGNALNTQQQLDAAVSAALSYGQANTSDTAGMQTRATAYLGDKVQDADDLTVTAAEECECSDGTAVLCSATCSGAAPYHFLRVTAQLTYKPFFSYPGLEQFSMESTVRRRVQ